MGKASIPTLKDQECLFLQKTVNTSIQLDRKLKEDVDGKHLYWKRKSLFADLKLS